MVTATVTGGTANTTAFSSGSIVLAAPHATLNLSASSSSPILGQPLTLKATPATSAPGAGVPTGVVVFKDGATVLGTVTLNSSGVATFTTSSLLAGVHNLTADYTGSAIYSGVLAPTLVTTVRAVPPTVLAAVRVVGSPGAAAIVVVSFSTAMNATTVDNAANYQLVALRATPTGLVPAGPTIRVASAVYNVASRFVVLVPLTKLSRTTLYRLTIVAQPPLGVANALVYCLKNSETYLN